MTAPYTLAAAQPRIHSVFSASGGLDRDALQRNVAHISALTRRLVAEHDVALAGFPEFSLQGYAAGRSVAEWIAASIRIPGPETDALAALARDTGCFVLCCAYEVIDSFPGRYFNTAFLIDDGGELVLTYRKLYAMTSKTRPGDVLDDWCERFGAESLFPVADTRLGRIGCLIARDVHWPETARCLALRGAELIINPTGAGAAPPNATVHLIRRVRAEENLVYFAMPNIGQFAGGAEALRSPRLPAQVIDYSGVSLDVSDGSDDSAAIAEIDINALRRARLAPGRNYVAQLQPELHTPIYAADPLFGSNGWAGAPLADDAENAAAERAALQRLLARGILAEPDP